ncbi:hypothetical protein ABZP36_001970 [Zizania latifolia]
MALSAAIIHLHLHDTMTPSAPRRISPSARRRRRNAAAGRSPIVGSSATARALAAGLWRLRHAAARRQDGSVRPSTQFFLLPCSFLCSKLFFYLDYIVLDRFLPETNKDEILVAI